MRISNLRFLLAYAVTIILSVCVARPDLQAAAQSGSGSGVVYAPKTFGLSNGHVWVILSSTERMAFIRGIIDGWALRESTDATGVSSGVPSPMNGISPTRASELSHMLDVAYADEENLKLPVGWVLMGSLAVQQGHTTTAVVMQRLRRHLADVSFLGRPVADTELNPIDAISGVFKKTP